MINVYNTDVLRLHRKNMDIQFATNAYACVAYILNYINKSNRGMSLLMRKVVEQTRRGNSDACTRMKTVIINATEISA